MDCCRSGTIWDLKYRYNNSKVKSGSSDTLLKSFGIMKYPIDADYGNTQDYIIITQYAYSPVRKDLFSGAVDSEGKPKAKIFSNIFSNSLFLLINIDSEY